MGFWQLSIFTPKTMIWKISNFDKKWCSVPVWKRDSLSKAKQTLAIDDLRLLFFFWITRAVLLQLPNLTLLFQIPIGRKMIQITTKGFQTKENYSKKQFWGQEFFDGEKQCLNCALPEFYCKWKCFVGWLKFFRMVHCL